MKAQFVKSSVQLSQLPSSEIPEFAFIGRSNVGKSSLINTLTSSKGLAKTSGSPGKTQAINHFIINEKWHLVDLPGYGFAKVSQATRAEWESLMKSYFLNRKQLITTFVLIDIRLEPQKNDLDFIEFLGTNGVPFSIVFTKSDKLTPNQALKKVNEYKTSLLTSWEELPPVFVTSATNRTGKEELLQYIQGLI
ncbi:MAG: ribosome biogenesis GTP-binding protein YihA/YsxC [Bacteroidota bacterium]|jgi:GTP-binding protein